MIGIKRMQGNGGSNPIRLIALLTCLFFFCSFIVSPGRSYAASIENLDEMVVRKARYASNPWPTNLLEDPNKNYIWQPETLCYTDVTTGHEVWILTHAPDISLGEYYSKEHGTNAWSYDGSRIGFFSINRPTKHASIIGDYHYRWVVNTDGGGLKVCEGFGRREIPLEGFSWAHTENAYYSFGSGVGDGTGSESYKLYKNTPDSNNVIRGSLVLDTLSKNTYKKEMVKDGVSTDDSHITFRDFTSRSLPTPNPINSTAVYFASLGASPRLNYWWGVARHIGPSTNNWADPYASHLPSQEDHFHDVWSPGPNGSWIMGQYSGNGGLFNIFKDHGSASDGGPLWQDWNGSSFGNNEIKVVSSGGGTPINPYSIPYFGHPVWDRWGRYALFANYNDPGTCSYGDNCKPGMMIYDSLNNTVLRNYPFQYNSWTSNHHSWTGWTDWVLATRGDSYLIEANKWNSTTKPGETNYQAPMPVVYTHHTDPNINYNAYPRPSQSPDGTKVAFSQYFLNSSQSYPYIAWAVVYYPSPPVNVRAQKNGSVVRLNWTKPSYTTRGWPNEATDLPPKAREIKGYHVWVSDNGVDGWTELTTTAVTTDYYDIAQANGTTKYYAVTSEEHSRLESRKLSEIRKVTLDSNGSLTDSQYAAEGKTGFWTTLPYAPSNFTVEKQTTAGQYLLRWIEPNDSKIRYYNIYYSTTGTPPADQRYRIASLPAGTSKYLDWLADSGQPGYYRITSVDRQGNEGTEQIIVSINISPPPTIVPSPIPAPTPEPAPIVSEPAPAPTPTPSPVAEPVTGGQVYVAVSEITSDGEAIGNVKRYELTTLTNVTTTNVTTTNDTNNSISNNTNGSTVVQIVDANNTPVLDSNNQIKESSTSAWSSSAVWKKVGKGKGGVGEVLLSRTKPRNIFTNIETTNSTNLMNESNEFAIENEKLTPEMLGLATGDTSEREKLIQYVHGFDAYAKDKEKASLQKRKWILGSIVNSRPLVIPYVRSKKVIFVGANDGMLHAFDDRTGEELWGFIPYELLGRLKELPQGNGLKYFVDGSPKAYITKSQKIIVFGLRRGGNNYYALDVTNPESPKFLWKIGPETTGFSEIGQTWSDPQFGKIKYGTGAKAVCIIGGGYDENQDRKTPAAEDKKGRAVYVVDLLTGVQIWRWDSERDPNMKHSIPSTIACADVNGDGYIDRLYVGDMGGKLWSFDLKGSDPNGWSGGRVVFNSNRGFAGSGKQKIFSKPDVTLEKGGEMVLFGTGDREHPHEKIGVDKFYAFLDKGQGTALSEDNLADVTKDFATVQNLANKEGWFISMEDKGEKVLAPPVVAFGVVYFTTFTPSLDGDGLARIYALNYRVGNPIFNLNSENDQGGPKIDLSDRSKIIGTGIPSGTVISALGGRPIAYTGFAGGLYSTHLKGHSTIIPISWKEVSKKK